ncbi:thymidine kinase [Desulfosporosinus acidiphilus SJ4]|uniref:Thymidine kinase n=1 Tax=Desulfosporosinus acidiphilus (strain DSM 22704 / JCM 16185 / SJ4) TaxID=646529 RepID=I4D3Z6_DESAJ|nr:thymidine kinase [Desulfosporosinus acidiphilus]AFM40520.1 thymidine kinase [Desulfosporosinus acidiphilus SJ4]
MAQLYFRYATMGSGKTADLLKIAYNYTEQEKKVLIFTPAIDTRFGVGRVTSRMGISKPAITIDPKTDIFDLVQREMPDCVLCDEGNFLTRGNVLEFCRVVDELDIPVIIYGLKNDFQNNLFEGSEALLIYADKIEEVKTVCWYCNRKATMVLRFKDGVPIFEGQQIEVGGNESYLPVCRRCWNKAREGTKAKSD